MRPLILYAIIALAAPVQAAPVYLNCMLSGGDGEEVLWNLAVDEAAGTVSYTIPRGNVTMKVPGVFTVDKVRFRILELDRVDLTITRFNGSTVDKGKCELVHAPARKF